jgi:hypothetical protein
LGDCDKHNIVDENFNKECERMTAEGREGRTESEWRLKTLIEIEIAIYTHENCEYHQRK